MIALLTAAAAIAAAPTSLSEAERTVRVVSADGAPVSLELVGPVGAQIAVSAEPTASPTPNLYEVPEKCRNLPYRVVDSQGRGGPVATRLGDLPGPGALQLFVDRRIQAWLRDHGQARPGCARSAEPARGQIPNQASGSAFRQALSTGSAPKSRVALWALHPGNHSCAVQRRGLIVRRPMVAALSPVPRSGDPRDGIPRLHGRRAAPPRGAVLAPDFGRRSDPGRAAFELCRLSGRPWITRADGGRRTS